MPLQTEHDPRLKKALKTRHISMLALGGVIAQPWTSIEPGKSPFVATLEKIGIPGAGTILTVVILVAVLSVLNAGFYTASRLLFVLAGNGEAPQWLPASTAAAFRSGACWPRRWWDMAAWSSRRCGRARSSRSSI